MRRNLVVHAIAAIFVATTPVLANDLREACNAFGSAEVIFVGRVKSAPITRRISGEDEIEKARILMDAADSELKAFEAQKMPPEIGWQRHKELTIKAVKAREEWGRTRAMHPPPVDLSLTPILVEVPFRGVTTPEVFMMNRGQPELDPSRSYLFYAERPMGPLAPDVIFAGLPKPVDSAESDLTFLRDAITSDRGTLVYGSLFMQDPDDQRRRTPLPGIGLRISLDDQRSATTTAADGAFVLSGVPPGLLKVDPVLPEHLSAESSGGIVKGGCLEINVRVTFNGRIRGRVLLDSGEPYRGFVDLVPENRSRYVRNSEARTDEHGAFSFSALPPGNYLLGINVSRQPATGALFRPTYFPGTTDRAEAKAVAVGHGTEHADVDWIVSSRLREGSIEVTFNTNGQRQKEMGVCVTMFDADNRDNGGVGYERRSTEPVIVRVVEGVRYRLVAWARTPSGSAESEIFDVIGAPGHRAITLHVASVSEKLMATRCPSSHSKPFSLPR